MRVLYDCVDINFFNSKKLFSGSNIPEASCIKVMDQSNHVTKLYIYSFM